MNDTDFLKEKLAKKDAKEAIKTNDPSNTTLEDKTSDVDLKEQIRQKRLHRQATVVDAQDTVVDARQEDANRQEEAQKEIDNSTNVKDVVGRNIDKAGQNVNALSDRISSIKTTGGIAFLLLILVLLLFIVVQVNSKGDTRLKQIWYMLNGRTQLEGKINIATQDKVSQDNTGANFGSGPDINNISDFTYRGVTGF